MTVDELPPVAVSWASTEKNPVGAWKEQRPHYTRGLSPCLVHCPVGNNIEGFISRLRDDDEKAASEILVAENPLPATCGRVCYHPCESGCNRAHLDGSVGIRSIERYLGDLLFMHSGEVWRIIRPLSGKRVAIAGSGPCGLACAWALALLGHQADIFERAEKPGGLLRYGIPAYRLPKEILDQEVNRLRDLGMRFFCGENLGSAHSLASLRESYDALFVATGASLSRSLDLGAEAKGICLNSLDFLTSIAKGRQVELGDRCVVVGGGNSAIDAARSARRLGASVTLLYRRTRAEMPAHPQEIEDALAESVELIELAIPKSLIIDNGKLEKLECLRTRLGEPDASGRRSPVPIPGSEFSISAATIINALGELVNTAELTDDPEFQKTLTAIGEWGESSVQGLFAGGDFAGSERSVAHAIGSGKGAAMAIDQYLLNKQVITLDRFRVGGGPASLVGYLQRGEVDILANGIQMITYEDLNPAYFIEVERSEQKRILERNPARDFREVETGLDPMSAKAEAQRCFSCGCCTRCGLCQIFCPEGAVRIDPETADYTIYDPHCKGCGICVEECPRGAIRMEPLHVRK